MRWSWWWLPSLCLSSSALVDDLKQFPIRFHIRKFMIIIHWTTLTRSTKVVGNNECYYFRSLLTQVWVCSVPEMLSKFIVSDLESLRSALRSVSSLPSRKRNKTLIFKFLYGLLWFKWNSYIISIHSIN